MTVVGMIGPAFAGWMLGTGGKLPSGIGNLYCGNPGCSGGDPIGKPESQEEMNCRTGAKVAPEISLTTPLRFNVLSICPKCYYSSSNGGP